MREQIEAVQRMQDYIEEHLCEDISMSQLARASLFPPWYARRIFLQYVGITPAEYIRKLRLKESVLKLRDQGEKVTDVALECGFGSVDGYQRAFHKEYGCNPKTYSTSPRPLELYIPYGVKFRNMEKRDKEMSTARKVFVQVFDKPSRKVILKRGVTATDYWTYCQEVGCDVWGILTSIRSIAGEPVCMWLPKEYILPGTSEYVQGVEVSAEYCGEIPDGFEVLDLPASKYLMFQGEPFEEEDFEIAIEEIWDAEQKYDPSLIGYRWDDSNPRIQLEPVGKRGYIEFVAVKALS